MDYSITELFHKGGAFMYPLLALSVLSVIIILERLWYYGGRIYRFTATLEQEPKAQSGNPLLRVMRCYQENVALGEEHCVNVSSREAARQVRHHERGLKLLATIGTISPLIGLLGTVWGMVQAFAKIAELGEQVTPGDFASGVWAGLLTTVAGLLVAIPAVTASRVFESKVDRLNSDLNELASHLKERHFPS